MTFLLRESNWLWNCAKLIGSMTTEFNIMQERGLLKKDMNSNHWKMQFQMSKCDEENFTSYYSSTWILTNSGNKWKVQKIVPLDLQDDMFYWPPTETEKKIVKEEKGGCWNMRNSKKPKILKEAE